MIATIEKWKIFIWKIQDDYGHFFVDQMIFCRSLPLNFDGNFVRTWKLLARMKSYYQEIDWMKKMSSN